MKHPKKITIGSRTYDCPKVIKAKGKRLGPKPGHILIQGKDWAMPTQFRYPDSRYTVSGTEDHPILTLDSKE